MADASQRSALLEDGLPHFRLWRTDGTLDRVHDALREQVRVKEGREAKPTAGIVDSQSVKGANTVGKSTRGASVRTLTYESEVTYSYSLPGDHNYVATSYKTFPAVRLDRDQLET